MSSSALPSIWNVDRPTPPSTFRAAVEREGSALIRRLVPAGRRVLELGCGAGDLLASLEPGRGVGVDRAGPALDEARRRHPHLTFLDAESGDLAAGGDAFDAVILNDVVGFTDDVWALLRSLRPVCHDGTTLVVTSASRAWRPLLGLAALVRRGDPARQSWLSVDDLTDLLGLNRFEVVRHGRGLLLPLAVPGLAGLCNRVLTRLPVLSRLGGMDWIVARPSWRDPPPDDAESLTVSVIIPTRNEAGNVADLFARVPEMGAGTELVFVDGHSTDGTVEEIEERLPSRDARLIHQSGVGKGDAVRQGFAAARGDVLMILDSDITVPPEDLPKFFLAVAEGRGEFVNGTRLVYPMERGAMRFLNTLGNRFFGRLLSWTIGQRLHDTLCGTKVLRAADYDRIVATRAEFGDFDPFGDFDLIFGAARNGMRIVEVPVRYRARTYGDTKISRFRHGWLLLRMSVIALWKFRGPAGRGWRRELRRRAGGPRFAWQGRNPSP